MSISNKQWAEVQRELEGLYAQAKFRYEGILVQVVRVAVSESTFALRVYLDGSTCAGWGHKNLAGPNPHYKPVTEKLWRKRTRAMYPPKKKQELIKRFGKRKAESALPGLNDVQVWYEAVFMSASSLVRQYKKLEGLELVSVGYQPELDSVVGE
ncbi:hypothetical protein [Oceanospirillum beijerinckii]|uniref:hypothetical protein n=1 Tax=Oceanospirillum beijerinckii TaxID=64976 RepID=UPI00042782EA|nr:hypothetical protein [Oceanospirillum beijerinckii]